MAHRFNLTPAGYLPVSSTSMLWICCNCHSLFSPSFRQCHNALQCSRSRQNMHVLHPHRHASRDSALNQAPTLQLAVLVFNACAVCSVHAHLPHMILLQHAALSICTSLPYKGLRALSWNLQRASTAGYTIGSTCSCHLVVCLRCKFSASSDPAPASCVIIKLQLACLIVSWMVFKSRSLHFRRRSRQSRSMTAPFRTCKQLLRSSQWNMCGKPT